MNPTIVIPLLVVIAAVFVVLPVAFAAYRYYAAPRTVRCPLLGAEARVTVDAPRAARAAVAGRSTLTALACSLLSERPQCRTECLTR